MPGSLLLRLLLVVQMLAFGSAAAQARNRALLIGVAAYDNPAIQSLQGPRNDVILLWRHLTAHGFERSDVTVLAEGLPSHPETPVPRGLPTRADILAAFDRLAVEAQAGDFVMIHFSGHGTTQPELDPNSPEPEPDGQDQVLLPKDAGRYDPATNRIVNGLIDDEIGIALGRIRDTGARVWMVIDACHSGTATRSGGAVARAVDRHALGVPDATRPALRGATVPERRGSLGSLKQKGSLVGFFAVDAWSEAIEREMPLRDEGLAGPPGKPRAGVFTWHLVRALNSGRANTFRDLSRQVALDMTAASNLSQAPLPVFDGDLDQPLGDGRATGPSRFPARLADGRINVGAGALAGLDEGAELALYGGPLSDAPLIARARILSSDAAGSVAELRESAGKVELPAALWASVESPGVALRYRVGAAGGTATARQDARMWLQRALAARKEGEAIAVEAVDDGPRDLAAQLSDGRLWLVPEGLDLVPDQSAHARSFSIAITGRDEQDVIADLNAALWTFARAANLVRIAGISELGAVARNDIEIRLERIRDRDPVRLAQPQRACDAPLDPAGAEPLGSGSAAAVSHCDQVRLVVSNRGDRDLDIGVFFVDPTGAISVPVKDWRQNGCVGFLPAKASRPLALRSTVRTWTDKGPALSGQHRILVFALPRAERQPANLCHLLQPSAASARTEAAATRGSSRRGFAALLERAALVDPSLRSANPFEDEPEEAGSVVVRQFVLDIRPPSALSQR